MRQWSFTPMTPGRRRLGILLLAVLAVATLGTGDTAAQTRQETLILARTMSDYITNDPSRTFEFTSQIIDKAAYDGLVTVEAPDFAKVLPSLATDWKISPDGLSYTFTLRKGAKFSSGNPVTAQDVRFSIRRLKHLKDQPSFFMDPVKDVEVVNDSTVRIILNAPDASFLAALACVPCGIVDSKVVMAKGGTDAEDAKEKDKATEWLNTNSAGSGPYRLTAFTKDVEAVLERNPNYWGPKPHFAKVIFKHVPSGTTQREMVERGEADVAHDFDADLVAKIKEGPRIKLLSAPSLNLVYLALNTNAEVSKQLGDKRVRQAIAYAVDYDGIVKGLLRGGAEQPPGNIPIGILGVDRTMARKRDVARAKKLLADAGHPNGFEMKLNFWTRALQGVPNEPLAAKIQADLAEVGIKVTLEPKEFSVVVPEFRAGKVQAIIAEWTPDFLDPHPWADAFYRKGGPATKRVAYDNPQVNDLVDRGIKEVDPKKRAEIYKEIQKLALEDAPYVPLVQAKLFVGINPAIKGYVQHPIWFVTLAKLSR
jgi:peptide/nickel transport system substrate-binding protein